MPERSVVVAQVTAAIRQPRDSDAQTVFVWLTTNRCLWMLNQEAFADRVEAVVGTEMLIVLVGKLHRWKAKKKERVAHHAALQVPEDEQDREDRFNRLTRFFKLDIQMEEPSTAIVE